MFVSGTNGADPSIQQTTESHNVSEDGEITEPSSNPSDERDTSEILKDKHSVSVGLSSFSSSTYSTAKSSSYSSCDARASSSKSTSSETSSDTRRSSHDRSKYKRYSSDSRSNGTSGKHSSQHSDGKKHSRRYDREDSLRRSSHDSRRSERDSSSNRSDSSKKRSLSRSRSRSPQRRRISESNDQRRMHSIEKAAPVEDVDKSYIQELELELQNTQEKDEERLIEERRKARKALLEKLQTEKPSEASHTDISANLVPVQQESVALAATSTIPKEDFDMFSDTPVEGLLPATAVDRSATDDCDDPSGYYISRIGEVIFDRYQVSSSFGKGVFSTVVMAKDLFAKDEQVAIKVIRNNETMLQAGKKECAILNRLTKEDPESKKHCIKLITSFEFKKHLCLVLEPMHLNLRELVHKYGKDIGLSIDSVRIYAKQLFVSLKHIQKCQIIHADIKPDNIMVSESKSTVKLCDFGSACTIEEAEITPYLVSRFYRAPEIILGLQYNEMIDVWSVGCVLAELYLGKILFQGKDNNEMLYLIMQLKGNFPNKMLRRAMLRELHFDNNFIFLKKEVDSVTQLETIRRVTIDKPTKDITSTLAAARGESETKLVKHFRDLLERIFILDPSKRITAAQALRHPFFTV